MVGILYAFDHLMSASDFSSNGFAIIPAVLTLSQVDALTAAVAPEASGLPGTRCLLAHDWCRTLVTTLRMHADIVAVLPDGHVAVQCTYFEKSVGQNWLVPIHQDLSIPVRARVANASLRGWSEKEGDLFVQPPIDVLEELVAVRVHLDPCLENDGPLQFVPSTHTRGRIDAEHARRIKRDGPVVTCCVDRGGVLLMRPLALHASSKASGTSRRRVLHVVFGPPELPYGLAWAQSIQ